MFWNSFDGKYLEINKNGVNSLCDQSLQIFGKNREYFLKMQGYLTQWKKERKKRRESISNKKQNDIFST